MPFTQQETADYAAAQARELAKLADDAGLTGLAHIFRMAALEAHIAVGLMPTHIGDPYAP